MNRPEAASEAMVRPWFQKVSHGDMLDKPDAERTIALYKRGLKGAVERYLHSGRGTG